jgi:hypothetical protein
MLSGELEPGPKARSALASQSPGCCRQVRGEGLHGQLDAICDHVRFIIMLVT